MDTAGHYQRPEVPNLQANRKMIWDDDKLMRDNNGKHGKAVVEKGHGSGTGEGKGAAHL